MRKLPVLVLAAAVMPPAFCARTVTLDLVDDLLLYARQKPDAKVAEELFDLELTERVSSARLARWEAELPGPKSRQAMVALADASVFLHPPPDEDPGIGAPKREKQDALLLLAKNYVTDTIPKLPNFFATRNTMFFSDEPNQVNALAQATSPFQAMHLVGTSSDKAYFQQGKEVIVSEKSKQPAFLANTLSTQGIFGESMELVLSDVLPSGPAWYRWEGNTDAPLAVFRYSVAEDKSHYAVKVTNAQSATSPSVAYHGEIAIDPVDGSIRRLTAMAELGQTSPIAKANVMVEYAPVEIGGTSYVCPVKSVSLAVMPTINSRSSYPGARSYAAKVNDVQFTEYHRFGAESRILTGDSAGQQP